MPGVEGLKTLFQIAVHSVVQCLDRWTADIPDECSYRDILGISEVIPPKFLEIILSAACETERIRKRHLQLLIHYRIRRLDLSRCKVIANSQAVANIIGYRCRNLTELNIAGLSRIRGEKLASLIPGLTHLEILNLARTSCNDQVLIAIAQHCPNLRELDISYNDHVSDYGIGCLCSGEFSSSGTPLPLEKVWLYQTWIHSDGVKMLLKSKNIIHVGYKDLMTVIDQLHPEYLELTDVPRDEQYALTNMTYEPDIFSDMSVDHAFLTFVAHCPNVTEFTLHSYQTMVTHHHIRYLTALENLQKLHLITFYVPKFFPRGLAPLLEVRGRTLTELYLQDMAMVNFEVIGYCCPNLTTLIFHHSLGEEPYDEKPIEQILPNFNKEMCPKLFSLLEHLTITISSYVEIPVFGPEMLQLLLANCLGLKTLELSFVTGLSDEVLETVLITNALPKLSKLSLTHCDYITGQGVKVLLDLKNPLKQLHLINCQQIRLQDVNYFRRLSKKKKWNLEVEYQ